MPNMFFSGKGQMKPMCTQTHSGCREQLFRFFSVLNLLFLASQDALEVIVSLSEWVSQSVTLRTELTDVTLVSEDTYRRLYWWDSGSILLILECIYTWTCQIWPHITVCGSCCHTTKTGLMAGRWSVVGSRQSVGAAAKPEWELNLSDKLMDLPETEYYPRVCSTLNLYTF